MDFFTHLMIGFLISSWVSGSFFSCYVVFGTLMAVLPDFDVLLFPLWRRLPITGHHGLTHALAFTALASTSIYILAIHLGFSDIRLLMLMLFTGSMHVFGDFITTWGVMPLYPLDKRYSKLNIDMSINPFLMLYFFIGALVLAASGFHYISLDMNVAATAIGAGYLVYFLVRTVMKVYFTRMTENRGFTALPTFNPFRWDLVKRTDRDGAMEVILRRGSRMLVYLIPSDEEEGRHRMDRISRCGDLVYTYWHPQVQAFMRVFRYPYFETRCSNGRLEIVWHCAEMGDAMSIRVIYRNQRLEIKREFRGAGKAGHA
jgi:membrane-bound metal-dependent hydrolase YbcI (DUF457 family)